MKTITTRKMQAFVLAAAIVAIAPGSMAQQYQQPAAAPMQAAAPAAPGSFCGNRPLCYEGMDFAATIVDFRTSTDNYNRKVLDAILRFQNKTNQVISLAYVDGSASALDDRGNRFGLNAAYGGVRGMGVTNGNNLDTKFMVGPGGTGDVRFELLWQPPANAIVGVNYELELDIREMNRVEGNQWTFGGETLMHYQGLANGVAGAAPASSFASTGAAPASGAMPASGSAFAPTGAALTSSASQPGCPPATGSTLANAANSVGAQNANTQATMANAQSAVANFKSMFGSKKAAAAPATTANASAPCVPSSGAASSGYVMPAASSPGYVTAPSASGSPVQAVGATSPVTANTTAKAAVKASAVSTTSSARPVVATKPAVATRPVNAPATAQAAKPAPAKPSPLIPAAKKTVDTPATQTTSPR